MKFKQLSLFIENKPGRLAEACAVLAKAGLNVETMALADTEEFGILRFLIKDWEQAVEVLTAEGTVPKVTDVLVVAVPNRPGGLLSLLNALAGLANGASLNIEYMYGFHSKKLDESVIVLRLNNPDLGVKLFSKEGIRVLSEDEVFD